MSNSTLTLTHAGQMTWIAFLSSEWCVKPVVCIGGMWVRKDHWASFQLLRKNMVSIARPRTEPKQGVDMRSSSPPIPAATGVPKIFLDQAEVTMATTMSRSAIYEAMQEKRFPTPVRLSARRVAWRASDILAWCDSRTNANTTSAGGEA